MPFQVSVQLLLRIVRNANVLKNSLYKARLRTFIFTHGLQGHSFFGNHLVFALVEAAHIHEAGRIFNMLASQNEMAWNVLLVGCVDHENYHEAFSLYDEMQKKGVLCPSAHTLVALLKACTKLVDWKRGMQIHTDICKNGWYKENVYIGSTLIDMYAKCGLMVKAQEVFDLLPSPNIVVWTSLIGGYIEHEKGEQALQCFNAMQKDGIMPDAPAFVLAIKACGTVKAIEKGQELHAEVERQGLLNWNPFLGSVLVNMYVKCNAFSQAKEIAKMLKLQNLASWNALVSGLAEQGHGNKALDCFKQMQRSGVSPNVVTLTSCVKACTISGNLDMGQSIHAELERLGVLETDFVACNALIDMHMKCGHLATARELFDKLPSRTIASWNSLIGGYVDHGHGDKAVNCFRSMRLVGVSPNHLTLVCGLKACSLLADVETGQEIHAEIESKGFLQDDGVGNSLINMYAKCGLLSTAQNVFDKLSVRDTASWTVLIVGYAENGYGEEALKRFEIMESEGASPNAATFVCSLRACSDWGWKEKGLELHAEIERRAMFFGEVVISVMNLYVGLGLIRNAREVFNRLSFKDEDSWNAMLVGYAEHGCDDEVIELFEQMQHEGATCNAVTFVWSLKSCGNSGAFEKGQDIHAELERLGWLKMDPSVSSVLIDMYINFGLLAKAKDVFDKLPVRDVVLWTAIISGYAENDQGEEALGLFKLMLCEGVSPNEVTLLCSLKACSSIGAADQGRELHIEIERKGLLGKEPLVGNTLVDMYASCGLLGKAQQVFEKLPFRTVVSCTALMAGYAQLGLSENVFQIYERMLLECIKPDSILFVVILNTCSRQGLLDESDTYFNVMSKEFGIVPREEHHYCMLDLVCRAGQFDKAERIVMKHPQYDDLVPWRTVLSACRNFGNVHFGRHAFCKALLLDNKDAASFALMSGIIREHSLEA
ncbi:hypothetical protein GOP47_0022241 [Adiantum capillus-veneris]|uniref:Pentatricopeptide repeat-containing protein n=1 Tax=Adiantum capillus-veneris TaxID=13818 RepID=A0A9D4U8Z0_ADICA|nr:hypothetical protein GOP47_0022241 [Adiantum capillus-veneris]